MLRSVHRRAELEQARVRQFQAMLERMTRYVHRVIAAGSLCHLDVISEDPRNGARAVEVGHPVDTRLVDLEITSGNVEATGIKSIAHQQQVAAPVIDRDFSRLVPR